jgi:Zn-dependent M28 family amino/carboxypeptidase
MLVSIVVAACRWTSGVRMPASDFPPDTLRGVVETLAGVDPPRNAANPESLARVAQFIAERMSAAGLKPRFDTFEVGGAEYHNVSALIGSGRPPRIVVGAHYDVFGDLAGADDNASGVAALLNIGARLAKRELVKDVELVAYTLEEPPHFDTENMGSARHARALAAAGVKVVTMFSLEMLGYYTDEPNSQGYPDEQLLKYFPTTGNFLAILGRSEDSPLLQSIRRKMAAGNPLKVYALSSSTDLPGIANSDHMNYWRHGVPAFLVTDTAFFRNPHYHKASDRPETLDYGRLQQAADSVYAAVVALAEGTK